MGFGIARRDDGDQRSQTRKEPVRNIVTAVVEPPGDIAFELFDELSPEGVDDVVLRVHVQVAGQHDPPVAVVEAQHHAVAVGVFGIAIRKLLQARDQGCTDLTLNDPNAVIPNEAASRAAGRIIDAVVVLRLLGG